MRTVLCLLLLATAADARACNRNANGLTAECVAIAVDQSPVVTPPPSNPVTYYYATPAHSQGPVTYYQSAPSFRAEPRRLFRNFRGSSRFSGSCANGSCQ